MKWNKDFPTFDEYCEIGEDTPVAVLFVECDESGQPIDKHIILSGCPRMGWNDADYIWFDYRKAIGSDFEFGLYGDDGKVIENTECYLTIYLDRGHYAKNSVYYMFVGWSEIDVILESAEAAE